MKVGKLTSHQLDFLRLLVEYKRREGVPPTIRELVAHGGFRSTRSVIQYLDALEAAGCIERVDGARNIRVRKVPPEADSSGRAETVAVPLIGKVAAGAPMLAEENVEAHVSVSKALARGPHKYFLLRVQGDSMNRAGINDGDLVLVRQQRSASNGDVIVALIDDDATVKEIQITREAIILKPRSTNKKHQPIILQRDVFVQGKVVATIPQSQNT